MLALGLIGARARVAVLVFLYLGVLDRVLLSLSSVFGCILLSVGCVFGCILLSVGCVFGCVLLCLRSVFSRILVLSLYWTRCYQARESKTEHAISHENIKSHFCLSLLERAYCWLLLLYG